MWASNPIYNKELKSLTRYRFDKVKERAELKQSITRLVCILFPELKKLVPTLHQSSVYDLPEEYPDTQQIAKVHLTLLSTAPKGHYKRDMALRIREAEHTPVCLQSH